MVVEHDTGFSLPLFMELLGQDYCVLNARCVFRGSDRS